MENWDEQAPVAPAPVVAELPEIKLFGKWSTDDVQVSDISLTVRTFDLHVYNMGCMGRGNEMDTFGAFPIKC